MFSTLYYYNNNLTYGYFKSYPEGDFEEFRHNVLTTSMGDHVETYKGFWAIEVPPNSFLELGIGDSVIASYEIENKLLLNKSYFSHQPLDVVKCIKEMPLLKRLVNDTFGEYLHGLKIDTETMRVYYNDKGTWLECFLRVVDTLRMSYAGMQAYDKTKDIGIAYSSSEVVDMSHLLAMRLTGVCQCVTLMCKDNTLEFRNVSSLDELKSYADSKPGTYKSYLLGVPTFPITAILKREGILRNDLIEISYVDTITEISQVKASLEGDIQPLVTTHLGYIIPRILDDYNLFLDDGRLIGEGSYFRKPKYILQYVDWITQRIYTVSDVEYHYTAIKYKLTEMSEMTEELHKHMLNCCAEYDFQPLSSLNTF